MREGIFSTGVGAYHVAGPVAGIVPAPARPAAAVAGLGELAEAMTDRVKDTFKPAVPAATGSGLFWLLLRAGGGYVVGAYMGHPIIGAAIGGFAPAPIVCLAIMGAVTKKSRFS